LKEIAIYANNVARKAHYRLHLINKNPMLEIIDDKKVTAEEREKAAVILHISMKSC
jgi:hypothetical protein